MSDIICTDPHNWLLNKLYDANKTDHETYRVYRCLNRYISDNREFIGAIEEVVPNVLRFKPLNDLADDCFFSVTFFPEFIRARKHRRGSPGVKFYVMTGKNAYSSIGYSALANNWEFWVDYIKTNVVSDK